MTTFDQSSSSNFFQDDINEEDTQLGPATQYDGRDMVVFAIDCSPKMMVMNEDGDSHFTIAMKCVQSVLLTKVFSNTTDLVGVLFYGTEKKENQAGFDHIYILQELDSPSPTLIKHAGDLINNNATFNQEYGITTSEFPLGNVFWTCADMFSAITKKTSSKRIFLITNEDNPHGDNINLRNTSLQRAKDLLDMNIEIELFGLDPPDHTFDSNHFYKDVLGYENEKGDSLSGGALEKGSSKLEELMTRIRRKESKKRSLFSIPFSIAKDLTISIKGYNLLMPQKRAPAKKVLTSGERVQEVEARTAYRCWDSKLLLTSLDVKHYYDFGGEKVVFTKDELASMRAFGDAELSLLGFKPRDALLPQYNYKHPTFIYPDEEAYEGSTRTFTALLDSVLKQDKIVICRLLSRSNTLPRVVALLPQAEKCDSDGIQIAPPGFNVIHLPFADDIRSIPVESTPQPTEEQLESMKTIISKLFIKGDYDPLAFENPSLQKHYATLQAIALDEDLEEIEDKTVPKFETINDRLGDDILAFKQLIPDIGSSIVGSRKRGLEDGSSTQSNKRQAHLDVEEAWKINGLDKCTVPVLKSWLSSRGIAVKGKKADFIDAVEQALRK
ncbi:SPOC like C-terminal domain-containing protein [Chlamydoabsidia padenii]|nr:SPOC like C-terminal domain-containing protein [Chlamydoabsidia padenii]